MDQKTRAYGDTGSISYVKLSCKHMTNLKRQVIDKLFQMSEGQRMRLTVVNYPSRVVTLLTVAAQEQNRRILTLYALETGRGVARNMSVFDLADYMNGAILTGPYACAELRVSGQPTIREPSGCTLPQINIHDFQVVSIDHMFTEPGPTISRTRSLRNVPYGSNRLRNNANLTNHISLDTVPLDRAVYIQQDANGTVRQVYEHASLMGVLNQARRERRQARSPVSRREFTYENLRRLRHP